MTRRNFLNTATASAAALATPLNVLSEPSHPKPAAGYQLLVLGTNWGFPGSYDEFCIKAKAAGYDGAEIWWPSDDKNRNSLLEALNKHGLKMAFLWGSG